MGRSASPALWALAVALAAISVPSAIADEDAASPMAAPPPDCSALLEDYLSKHKRDPQPYTDESQLVYFLHVPRTAGRTFHSCFLKLGTPPNRRCPKAYDHLRLNMSVPNCYLLSSHDDFSVVSMLPENVAVLTHLRDPVDRFLSAYEFAIEVGSRVVNKPTNFRKRPDKIATEDVWPWSYLVPYLSADTHTRMLAARAKPQPEGGNWIFVRHPDGDEFYYNKVLGESKWNLTEEEKALLLPPLNPYNNSLVMPLAEFIQHPVAKELLHNGQTFQVLGVTNYSHWGDHAGMRECFWHNAATTERLMQVATGRVEKFMHVGVTDRLSDSVAAAAVAMKFSVVGNSYGGGDDDAVPAINTRASNARLTPPPATSGGAHSASPVAAEDLPDVAEKVKDARFRLQQAQRNLFLATQAAKDESEIMGLKAQVGNLREELRKTQDLLLEARSKLPTSTDTPTAAKKAAAAKLGKQGAAAATVTNRPLGSPLGLEYQRCANRAQTRNLQRRDTSLAILQMPDARHVVFGKEQRKLIPPELIEQIRQLNQGDLELHRLGTQILERNMQRWNSEGILLELPPLPPVPKVMPKQAPKYPIPKPKDKPQGTMEEL